MRLILFAILFSIPYQSIKVESLWDKSLHCKQIPGLDSIGDYCLSTGCGDVYIANHLVHQKDNTLVVTKFICWE